MPRYDDTTSGPRAIETIYNGFRFRSRLEARWAVFFDVLGIKYEYEKEGFDLGSAGWYLPDFWLSGLGIWAEVKPNADGWTPEAVDKATELCRQSSARVLALAGLPDDDFAELLTPAPDRQYGVLALQVEWSECELCGRVTLRRRNSREIATAMERAKSARFEFGESGG